MTPHYTFSDRTNWEFNSNQLSIELEKMRLSGQEYFDLTQSNPTNCGFHYPQDLLSALSNSDNLTYSPDSKGLLAARQAIVRYYQEQGISVDPESIILTASTSEGYTYLFRLLLNPGDKVLVARPSYPLFSYLIELCDAHYDGYTLVYENNRWQIDIDSLEAAIDPSVKAVIFVNPNNPTGSYVSRDELDAVNQVCRRHNLAIISDEVFFDYRLDKHGPAPVSLAQNAQVLTFTLNGISKSLGLPQMKLSWIVCNGPRDLVDESVKRLEMIADSFLSVNTPVQNALAAWLNARQDIQQEILRRAADNHELIKDFANRHGLSFYSSSAGWYAVIYSPQFRDEEQWVLKALSLKRVLVHPGYFYDFPNEGFLVVSLLPQSSLFNQGLKALSELIGEAR
ncbi:MAG: pyridoxal phosphate-dependent aminotransferase [Candidatus Omnitrophica bacterium]|nr:pyridoxal phosphate-dependent aminotransferase [Candidatus Omnitrophota bacterium]